MGFVTDRVTGRAAFAVSTDEIRRARPVTGKPNQKVVKNVRKYLDEFFMTKSARINGNSRWSHILLVEVVPEEVLTRWEDGM